MNETVQLPLTAILTDRFPDLARLLKRNLVRTPPRFRIDEVRYESTTIGMRDGTRLATDLYRPPPLRAPTVAFRTPYGRARDIYAGVFLSLARRGYVVVSQDCRGTGDSEPENWDYYMYEPDDGWDLVEWISRQPWFDGFLGSFGASYDGQTQWPMAMHPHMSTIVPEVSGLGIAINTLHLHMFANSYARSVGKGEGKVDVPYFDLEEQMLAETLSTGYFSEPLYQPFPKALVSAYPQLSELSPVAARRWLWERYCSLPCAGRAELVRLATGSKAVTMADVESLSSIFGHQISHDAHTLPHTQPEIVCERFHAPVLLRTGWYDWGLNDALATWDLLMRAAAEPMRSRCRLVIAPSAHNAPGYHEGMTEHPELHHEHRMANNPEFLLRWYQVVRDEEFGSWPTIIYYLMGANEWRAADGWPVPGAKVVSLYLQAGGALSMQAPEHNCSSDRYVYDPDHPTPTVGGSILSYVYPPGSVDVSKVQTRPDVLVYSTEVLKRDLEVVGPLRLILYASSSARDTDFCARVSDVFEDGRAIQLQSGALRARYRNLRAAPALLERGRVYRLEIDLWATANTFKAGHRLRVDISSADFPRFDRNSNRGEEPGRPIKAEQTVYHDAQHRSQLIMYVLAGSK
jgi:uncharacterized protein